MARTNEGAWGGNFASNKGDRAGWPRSCVSSKSAKRPASPDKQNEAVRDLEQGSRLCYSTPVSYPVPDGCPGGADFGQADIGQSEWARAVNADLVSGDLRSPLPSGGCAYLVGDIGTSKNGADRYQRVIVAYFNLDTSGRLTQDDLETWGTEAGGVPRVEENPEGDLTGETSDNSLALPDDFTDFDTAKVSWVDGTTRIRYADTLIPAFTQGASGQIEYYLKAERGSAIEAASVSGGTICDAISGIIAIDASASAVTLTAIDPSTGTTMATRTFKGPQAVLPRVNMASSYIAQQGFSPDFDRVAATMTIAADNSNHVGWINKSGQFVDVSEAITGAQSGFSDTIQHVSPVFGADGAFYYLSELYDPAEP